MSLTRFAHAAHFAGLQVFWFPVDCWVGFLLAFWITSAKGAQESGNHVLRRDLAYRGLRMLRSPAVREPLASRIRVLRRMKRGIKIANALRRYHAACWTFDEYAR